MSKQISARGSSSAREKILHTFSFVFVFEYVFVFVFEIVLAARKLCVVGRGRKTTQQFVRLQFKLKQFISCQGGRATINELTQNVHMQLDGNETDPNVETFNSCFNNSGSQGSFRKHLYGFSPVWPLQAGVLW